MNCHTTFLLSRLMLLWLTLLLPHAQAHDFKAGSIIIDHPYATPTPAGATTAGVYFRNLRNGGNTSDRLVGAGTPIARSVEIHQMQMDSDVMRMRALPALELPAGASIPVRHNGNLHLMLLDINRPLKQGERFPITLQFERSGTREVMVWVQQPRDANHEQHQHH